MIPMLCGFLKCSMTFVVYLMATVNLLAVPAV
jgi:hypothetical protein